MEDEPRIKNWTVGNASLDEEVLDGVSFIFLSAAKILRPVLRSQDQGFTRESINQEDSACEDSRLL